MRSRFLMNILLSFVWVALTGVFEYPNFLFGFLLSFIIMWVISRVDGDNRYFTVAIKIIGFFIFFMRELTKANIEVAYAVVARKFRMKPGIVCLPLSAQTDLEITLLANLISLTPGTLSLDVSDDRKVLYVHVMYLHDQETFVQSIKNGFERRLLSIMR